MADIFSGLDTIAGVLLAGALTMIALTHKEMRAARILIALTVVTVTARWEIWALITNDQWPLRAFIGAVLGAVMLAGSPALWQWSKHREIESTPRQAPDQVSYNPLRLSKEKKRAISSNAILPTGISGIFTFNIVAGCNDCQIFAEDLRDILNQLPGWEVNTGLMPGPAMTYRGVSVAVASRDNQPMSALALERAFQAADIAFTLIEDPVLAGGVQFSGSPAYQLQVYVGPIEN